MLARVGIHTHVFTYRILNLPAGAFEITRVNEKRYIVYMHTCISRKSEKKRRVAGNINEPRIHRF